MLDRHELPNRRPPIEVIELPPVQGDAQYQLLRGGGVIAYLSHVFTPNRAAGRALYCWGYGPYGSFDGDHVAVVRTHRARGDTSAGWAPARCCDCGAPAPAQAADPDRFGRPRCRRCAAVREK